MHDDNFSHLLAYVAKNNLNYDDLLVMASDADDDLNGVNDKLFCDFLNVKYNNICKKLDKNLIDGVVYKNINAYLLGISK